MITFHLDFTPIYVGGLIIGLVLIVIGISIRSRFRKSPGLGTFVIAAGAIPALLGALLLISDRVEPWWKNREYGRRMEQLPEDREVQGIRLPRGTKVEWRGRRPVILSATFEHSTEVLGIAFEGELKFDFHGDDDESMFATKGMLAADRIIDTVPCKAHTEVEFESPASEAAGSVHVPRATRGKLMRCTLSTQFEFRGNRYQPDSEVNFNLYTGAVEKGVLAVDQDVNGHWCKQGTEVDFTGGGNCFTLARNETIGGIACKAGDEVRLNEKNEVLLAVLAHDQRIGGVSCRGGETVRFTVRDVGYVLEMCVINEPHMSLGVLWPAGSSMDGLSSASVVEVTLPANLRRLAIGDVTVVGRCKVHLSREPLELAVEALDKKGAYAEMPEKRYTSLTVAADGTGSGILAEAAKVNGVAVPAGTKLELFCPNAGECRPLDIPK